MKFFLNKMILIKSMFIIAILISLIIISHYNYLLFHFIIEFMTAIIGYIMFSIVVNTRNFSINNSYSFLGIAYAFIGTIDLIHAIVYKGMNIINITSANIATQMWIIARYIESISWLVLLMLKDKNIKYTKLISIYFLIFIYSIAIVFKSNLFPVCYVDRVGLTKFKIISEYIICIILIIAIYLIYQNKNNYNFAKNEYNYLVSSLICTILSEMLFTCYINVYEISNMLGHILKLISFYYIYIALIEKNIQDPYKIIFSDLDKNLKELKKCNNNLYSKNDELEKTNINLEKNLKIHNKFLDVLPFAVIIRDKNTIVYINDKTKKLLKLNSEKDLIGTSLLDILSDEYKTLVKKRINMELTEKIGLPIVEKFICSDGSLVEVEVTVTSILFDGEEYFMGILKDITHLRKLKLVEMKLDEKIQYECIRNEFFANISHEFKTPVNVIYSALQLEEIYFKKENYDEIKKNNKIIMKNCMRLLRLVNNLIDITKIDSGFFKPKIKCNNLVEHIEDIVSSVVPYVKNRNMSIIFDTELEEEYVNCDLDLIERIILNLISNSIKYGKSGGHIYVNIYNDLDKMVCICVKDDGIGIPKSKQQCIFDRFIRIDKSLSRNCEGSGIGLSLVKSLVEIQNGIITLNSEENQGTEVIVKFPIAEMKEEVLTTIDKSIEIKDIIKRVDLEFSDIYDL